MNKKTLKHAQSQVLFLVQKKISFHCSGQNTNDNLGSEVSIEVKATSQEPPPGMMIPEASAVSYPFFLPKKNLQNIWFYKKKITAGTGTVAKKHNNKTCH